MYIRLEASPERYPGQGEPVRGPALRGLPPALLLAAHRDIVRRLQMPGHRQRVSECPLALRALQPLDAPAPLACRAARGGSGVGDGDHAVARPCERAAQLLDKLP